MHNCSFCGTSNNVKILSVIKFVFQSSVFMILGAILSFIFLENDLTRLLELISLDVKAVKRPLSASTDGRDQNETRLCAKTNLLNLTRNADHIRYFPHYKILISVTAKGGSTSVWKWMYTSMTGNDVFNCSTYVQNIHSNCWKNQVVQLPDMSEEQRLFALKDDSVFRVAVWRDPFERILSSWKSKFACDAWIYGTDYPDRARMVPQLLKAAGLPYQNVECLNISTFAIALDHIRRRVIMGELNLAQLNPHIRPQQFYFNLINYSLVVDLKQLSNGSVIKPLSDLLPFAPGIPNIERLHTSKGPDILIPQSVATLISKFSSLTEIYPEILQ